MSLKQNSSDSSKSVLKQFSKDLKGITKGAENLLNPPSDQVQNVEKFLQQVYSYVTTTSDFSKNNIEVLPELYMESLDVETVWQQIDIKNNIELPLILEHASNVLAIPDTNLEFKIKLSHEDDQNESDIEKSDEDEENYSDTEKKKTKTKITKKKKKEKQSIVDDNFFKLSEMDAFLEKEDKKEELKTSKRFNQQNDANDDGIDYFSDELGVGDDPSDDEVNLNYKDFFDVDSENGNEDDNDEDESYENSNKKNRNYFDQNEEDEADIEENNDDNYDEDNNKDDDEEDDDVDNSENEEEQEDQKETETEEKKVQNNYEPDSDDHSENDESDSEDDSNKKIDSKENEVKSSFEVRQKKLDERIAALEEQALAERPWQLKGEIKAHNRPQNSLLEEILEFDAGTRPAPIITEETNLRLEDIIRQRIKDQAWDDPERKVKPVQGPEDFRKKLILDSEKSKQSLAQIYEKEYQNQMEKLNIENDTNENEEQSKLHKEIKIKMAELFKKLDALSNFHFTPKPIPPEPKIITNTPVINIEEVAPVAVSDAQFLAPEEIKSRSKGDVLGSTERSKTDKKRERRFKKEYQKRVFKAKEERDLEKQKAGIPLTTKEEKDKALRNVIKHRNVSKMSEGSDSAAIKSSKLFFNKLQDSSSTGVIVKRKSDKVKDSGLSAKKLKL